MGYLDVLLKGLRKKKKEENSNQKQGTVSNRTQGDEMRELANNKLNKDKLWYDKKRSLDNKLVDIIQSRIDDILADPFNLTLLGIRENAEEGILSTDIKTVNKGTLKQDGYVLDKEEGNDVVSAINDIFNEYSKLEEEKGKGFSAFQCKTEYYKTGNKVTEVIDGIEDTSDEIGSYLCNVIVPEKQLTLNTDYGDIIYNFAVEYDNKKDLFMIYTDTVDCEENRTTYSNWADNNGFSIMYHDFNRSEILGDSIKFYGPSSSNEINWDLSKAMNIIMTISISN